MKKSEMVKLATLIATINTDETLSKVINMVKSQQKIMRASAALVAKASMNVGDIVKINSRKQPNLPNGKILKINRTKADVLIDGTTWTVPLTMMEAV